MQHHQTSPPERLLALSAITMLHTAHQKHSAARLQRASTYALYHSTNRAHRYTITTRSLAHSAIIGERTPNSSPNPSRHSSHHTITNHGTRPAERRHVRNRTPPNCANCSSRSLTHRSDLATPSSAFGGTTAQRPLIFISSPSCKHPLILTPFHSRKLHASPRRTRKHESRSAPGGSFTRTRSHFDSFTHAAHRPHASLASLSPGNHQVKRNHTVITNTESHIAHRFTFFKDRLKTYANCIYAHHATHTLHPINASPAYRHANKPAYLKRRAIPIISSSRQSHAQSSITCQTQTQTN